MVGTAVNRQQLVGMAVETNSGIGARADGVNNLLSRAVMTGITGADPVGRNIVLGAFDFSPVRHNMAVAAEDARRLIGKVVEEVQFYGM